MRVELTTRHGKMILPYTNDYIAQQLMSNGEYEWYVIDIIKHLSQGHADGIILDIGANLGTVSLAIAQEFPQYQIHSFEIQPLLLSTLTENIKLNNLKNVITHGHGLGNSITDITIKQPNYSEASNIGAFSLNPKVLKHSNIAVGHGDEITINVVPLDQLEFDLPIRCIKLDVEGYEQFVIEGALETLKKHNYPPIVYEMWSYNSWWKEEARQFNDLLTGLGYQIKTVDDTGIATHS